MDPMKIDTTKGELVVHASSKGDGRPRWTEISVFYFTDVSLGGRRWVTEVKACSNLAGERTKTRRLASGSLDRALKLIDDSDLGIVIRETAQEFAEALPARNVPQEEREAIAWLYGSPTAELSINRAATDLGTTESTIRAALRANRPVKVSLRSLLPFINREAFQRANGGQG